MISGALAAPLCHKIAILPLLIESARRGTCSSISRVRIRDQRRHGGILRKCALTRRATIGTDTKVVLCTTPHLRRYGGDGGTGNHSGMVSIRVNRPISGIFAISSITFAISQRGDESERYPAVPVNIAGRRDGIAASKRPHHHCRSAGTGNAQRQHRDVKRPQAEGVVAASGAATPRISLPKLSLLPLSFLGHMSWRWRWSLRRRAIRRQKADYRRRRVVPTHCAPSFRD